MNFKLRAFGISGLEHSCRPSRLLQMSTTKEPGLGAEMPSRTPGRSDFTRPTFALGRISLGSSCTSDDETPRSRRSLSAPPSAGSGAVEPLQASRAGSYDIQVCQTPHSKERLYDSYCRAQSKPSYCLSSPFSGNKNLDTRRLSAGWRSSSRARVNCDGATLPEEGRGTGVATAIDDGREASFRGATDGASECDRENISPTTCRYEGSDSGTPFRKQDPLSSESRPSWRSSTRRTPLGHAQEHHDGTGEDASPAVYQFGGNVSVAPLPQQDPMSLESWQSYSPRRSPADRTHELSDHRGSDGDYKCRKRSSPTAAAAVPIQQRGSNDGLSYGSPIGTPASRAKSDSSLPESPAGSDDIDGATSFPERNESATIYFSGSSNKRSSSGMHRLDIHSPRSMHANQDRWGVDPHGRVPLGPGDQSSDNTGRPTNRGQIPSYKRRSYSGGEDIDGGNSSSDAETGAGIIDACNEDDNRSSASTTRASPPADADDVMLVQDSNCQSRMDYRGDGQKEPGEWEEEVGGLRWKMEAEKNICETSMNLETPATESEKPPAFSVPAELYKRMYPHQREGVRWLWGLHQGDMGGILGDDMGMGKTFQVSVRYRLSCVTLNKLFPIASPLTRAPLMVLLRFTFESCAASATFMMRTTAHCIITN